VHSDPDILLVDEVLAVGDEPFQLKCMTKIRQFQHEGRTIILVSHSAEQVADICTRAIVLDSGRLVHDGDVAEGIRTLRDGYERDRVQAEAEHSAGRPPAAVVRAATVRANGRPVTGPVEPRSDLEIAIAVDLLEPIEWVTGFTLSTPLGQAVYRLNSEGLGIALPTVPGSYEVSFLVKDANFASSRLVLSAGATTADGAILSVLDPAGHLDFTNDPAGAGFVQFTVAGAVEPSIVAGS
jgi:ABC-2 type transport system ATP-binding protein